MAVALTSTVNLIFGSQVLDPETGIILNDEMDDFSIPNVPNAFGLYPSPCRNTFFLRLCNDNTLADNFPEPGKRPLSSTVPTILENPDGTFYIAIGGSGGSRIFPSVFQVLLNIDRGMDLSQAIEYGRLHDQLYPLYLDADDVFPQGILRDLRRRGHNVTGKFCPFVLQRCWI
jgi:gamma-glutamyltranspeptidase/glutathione hydrolase/leukotriene-C4 hydrolase